MKCVSYIVTLSIAYHGMEFVLQNFGQNKVNLDDFTTYIYVYIYMCILLNVAATNNLHISFKQFFSSCDLKKGVDVVLWALRGFRLK